MKLAETHKIVPMGQALDMSAATVVTESVNCKNLHHATIIFSFDALGTDHCLLTVHSGTSDASLDSTLTFRYAFGGGAILAANSDVLAATATSASLDVDETAYTDHMLVVDLDMSEMDIANGESWLTCKFTDSGSATGLVSVIGIFETRYGSNRSATVTA